MKPTKVKVSAAAAVKAVSNSRLAVFALKTRLF